MRPARRLAGALVLATTLLPLAACRHGGGGLASPSPSPNPAKPAPPLPSAGLERPQPAGPNLRARIDPAEEASWRQLEHPLPPPRQHRHSGVSALSHTVHLAHPRYR